MTIRTGDTVRFLDNYGNCDWQVLERGKRSALLRASGKPDSLEIRTNVHNLRLTDKEKRR